MLIVSKPFDRDKGGYHQVRFRGHFGIPITVISSLGVGTCGVLEIAGDLICVVRGPKLSTSSMEIFGICSRFAERID